MEGVATVRQVDPWREARLRCAIGHTYLGRSRVVCDLHHDMDGEDLWGPPRADYDPATCIVCGLRTWSDHGLPSTRHPPDIGADVPGGGAI